MWSCRSPGRRLGTANAHCIHGIPVLATKPDGSDLGRRGLFLAFGLEGGVYHGRENVVAGMWQSLVVKLVVSYMALARKQSAQARSQATLSKACF